MTEKLKKGQMLAEMLVIIANAHNGQFDKAGMPYVLHPLKVFHYTRTDDEELQCIALGHDLFEDTSVTAAELRERGFSERVINGIRALTKMPGETPEEYEGRVMANPDAIRVKMSDLRHNSDIRRLKGVTEKDIKRTVKYQEFYQRLKEVLEK